MFFLGCSLQGNTDPTVGSAISQISVTNNNKQETEQTMIGKILPPGMEALPLREKLEDTVEGITFLDLVSLTNRGMQVEKI